MAVESDKIRYDVNGLCEDVKIWKLQGQRILYENDNRRKLSKCEFMEEMKIKYSYLFSKSETLFNKCFDNEINNEQLTFILSMLDKVNSGHDYHKTSTEVGQYMVDTFVKPHIPNK